MKSHTVDELERVYTYSSRPDVQAKRAKKLVMDALYQAAYACQVVEDRDEEGNVVAHRIEATSSFVVEEDAFEDGKKGDINALKSQKMPKLFYDMLQEEDPRYLIKLKPDGENFCFVISFPVPIQVSTQSGTNVLATSSPLVELRECSEDPDRAQWMGN